ncbi:MAG: M15 family metallopeptidase [Usitatibacter sp.]
MANTLPIESLVDHPHFRRLDSIGAIRVDLRYAGNGNFVGQDLYSPFDCAWLHRHAAERLEKAAGRLAAARPDLSLLVLDALRPQRVQERMWKALQGTDLTKYLADPVRGSIHSFGMAVDVTLIDSVGRELDMGTPFDDLTERSHPVLERDFLANGGLVQAHIDNRAILRDAMIGSGWLGITREWWHFDGGDRDTIRAGYVRIL